MAAPGIPSNFIVQTGNGQNLSSWDITAGATSYDVQRSLDGVTYTALASVSGSPLATSYNDSTGTLGTQYWYKVRATNSDGSSSYTTAQSVVPTTNGEMCLSQIRLAAQQRADRVNSQFVTKAEWNSYINQSMFELYDLLVTAYGEEYFAASPAQFTTNGSSQFYPLPNGVLSFTNSLTGASYVAPAFYKLLGVDLGLNANTAQSSNGWVTLGKFNFQDRNRYFYPNTQSTIYGVFNAQYRLVGNNIEFIPCPSANQPIRLWYIPRMDMLLSDTDTTTTGISGWAEYLITDAAIKALQKEESDVSVLTAQKAALVQRINGAAMNRDAGRPDTITDSRSSNGSGWNGSGGPGNGFGGGWLAALLPYAAQGNGRYQSLTNSIFVGQSLLTYAVLGISLAYVFHCVFSKAGSRITATGERTSFVNHVLRIIKNRAEK